MISVLLFDLGGVLYDIDMQRTQDALRALSTHTVHYELRSQSSIFDAYESGQITTNEFLDRLRFDFGISASDDELIAAWNSLLLGVIPNRQQMLEDLRGDYRLVLLSNINDLHYRKIEREVEELFAEFESIFLSYKVHNRKPNASIFHTVLDTIDAEPSQVLFVEDSPQHIATAQRIGINTYHVTATSTVEQWYQEFRRRR